MSTVEYRIVERELLHKPRPSAFCSSGKDGPGEWRFSGGGVHLSQEEAQAWIDYVQGENPEWKREQARIEREKGSAFWDQPRCRCAELTEYQVVRREVEPWDRVGEVSQAAATREPVS